MTGTVTGGERERAEGTGRIPCSPKVRWRGRQRRRRSDGDDSVHGDGGGRRTSAARFARLEASRQAQLEEEKEELVAVLVVGFDSPGMAGNDGERR